jgi:hypothetical protein
MLPTIGDYLVTCQALHKAAELWPVVQPMLSMADATFRRKRVYFDVMRRLSLLDDKALDGAAEIAARYSPGEPGGTSPSFEKSAFYGRFC